MDDPKMAAGDTASRTTSDGLFDKMKSLLGLGESAGKSGGGGGSPGFWTSLASGNLTKNPLGIIGLFIGLIYGFASLLLTVAAGRLSHDERMPLIWFMVGFPVLVLAAFYRLVTAHHEKLYAPEDFRDDQSFLEALDPGAARQRTQEKLETTEAAVAGGPPVPGATALPPGLDLGRSLAGPNVSTGAVPDPVDELMRAEELALNRLERDLATPIERRVSFGDGRQTAFDGVIVKPSAVTAIEVKVFSRSLASTAMRETVARALLAREKLREARRRASDFNLLVVLVTGSDNPQCAPSVERATSMASSAGLPVKVKVYSPADLKAG